MMIEEKMLESVRKIDSEINKRMFEDIMTYFRAEGYDVSISRYISEDPNHNYIFRFSTKNQYLFTIIINESDICNITNVHDLYYDRDQIIKYALFEQLKRKEMIETGIVDEEYEHLLKG